MTENRRAAYTDAGMTTTTGEHVVAIVDENEPGYYETTYTGSLDYCRGVAESINAAYGHDPEAVTAIVTSSMAAQNAQQEVTR